MKHMPNVPSLDVNRTFLIVILASNNPARLQYQQLRHKQLLAESCICPIYVELASCLSLQHTINDALVIVSILDSTQRCLTLVCINCWDPECRNLRNPKSKLRRHVMLQTCASVLAIGIRPSLSITSIVFAPASIVQLRQLHQEGLSGTRLHQAFQNSDEILIRGHVGNWLVVRVCHGICTRRDFQQLAWWWHVGVEQVLGGDTHFFRSHRGLGLGFSHWLCGFLDQLCPHVLQTVRNIRFGWT